MEITPADILEKAADILETEGWCQENYTHAERGRVNITPAGWVVSPSLHKAHCTIGAIMCATTQFGLAENDYCDDIVFYEHEPMFREALALVAETIPDEVNDVGERITLWNDEDERTFGDVTDALKRAAKEYRNHEH